MEGSSCNSAASFDPETKDIKRFPSQTEEMSCQRWKLFSKNGSILGSKCLKDEKCVDEAENCQFCLWEFRDESFVECWEFWRCFVRFTREVPLPHLPDMIFPNNVLQLKHDSGVVIEFTALEALKGVGEITKDLVIACSQSWKDSRLVVLMHFIFFYSII